MAEAKTLEQIKKALLKKEQTVAVAESVTTGMLQLAFGQVQDASAFYHGGITAYNLGQKARFFEINTIHAEETNCVSGQMAIDMAHSVRELFNADYGLGITGYASLMPEKKITSLYAHIACANAAGILFSKRITSKLAEGEATQAHYVDTLLKHFLKALDQATL